MISDQERASVEEAWIKLIEDPNAGGSRRRILPHLQAHDMWFIVMRPGSQLGAELTLGGPFGDLWRGAKDLRGVGVVVTPLAPERSKLVLTETQPGQSDLFRSLTTDLVGRIDPTGEGRSLDAVLVRLEAWRRFFASGAKALSAESQLGLYGELLVLLEVVASAVGPEMACRTWTGPDPAIQDFQLPGGSVEVKTTRSAEPVSVTISSERQLDSTGAGELLLVVNQLDAREDGPGETLPALVGRCRHLASGSPAAAMALEDSLLAAGYLDSDADRYLTRYSMRHQSVYWVTEGFPRIVPSMLPAGVGSVRYQLAADACAPWRLAREEVSDLLGREADSDQWRERVERLQGTYPMNASADPLLGGGEQPDEGHGEGGGH